MSIDLAWEEHLEDLANQEMINSAIAEIPIERASTYLGIYGDAIQARAEARLNEAGRLLEAGFSGPALVSSVTGLEIIIRFLILRPLVDGAFLSDDCAAILADRIVSGRSVDDRRILPKMLAQWGIGLESLVLPNGRGLLGTLDTVWQTRNAFVHKSEPVETVVAQSAINCADGLVRGVIVPLARILGLSWPESGVWHKVIPGIGGGTTITYFVPKDPFHS